MRAFVAFSGKEQFFFLSEQNRARDESNEWEACPQNWWSSFDTHLSPCRLHKIIVPERTSFHISLFIFYWLLFSMFAERARFHRHISIYLVPSNRFEFFFFLHGLGKTNDIFRFSTNFLLAPKWKEEWNIFKTKWIDFLNKFNISLYANTYGDLLHRSHQCFVCTVRGSHAPNHQCIFVHHKTLFIIQIIVTFIWSNVGGRVFSTLLLSLSKSFFYWWFQKRLCRSQNEYAHQRPNMHNTIQMSNSLNNFLIF